MTPGRKDKTGGYLFSAPTESQPWRREEQALESCSQDQESDPVPQRAARRPRHLHKRRAQPLRSPAAVSPLLLLLAVTHASHCMCVLCLPHHPVLEGVSHDCQGEQGQALVFQRRRSRCTPASKPANGATAFGPFLGRALMAQATWVGR